MLRLQVDPARPDPAALERAVEVLRQGGIVAFPSDTLYGLSCDPANLKALEALFRLKGRPPSRRLPFIAGDAAQARELVSFESETARRLAERFWPGPLSLVLPLSRPDRLAVWPWGKSLAIRVPALQAARELALMAGLPIPATSANLSGRPPVRDPDRLEPALTARLDLLLDGGPLPESLPSTLIDLTTSPPKILRRGAISREALESVPGAESPEPEEA